MNTQETQITVTGRHVSITPPIKEYAEKKLHSIGIDFPKLLDAHFILDVQKYRHICEVVVHCSNHIHIEAEDTSDNMYASIDMCMDKLARQLRKYKTKIQHHRPRKQKVVHIDKHVISSEGLEDHVDAEPKLVHKETFAVKPMFTDEAVLQMELSAKQFLVFLNPTTDQINVMYRRKAGNFGLIEAALPK